MKMNIANWRMEQMIDALAKYTKETGKIGYAVAKNLQTLKNAAMPYFETRQKMFMQYGHPVKRSVEEQNADQEKNADLEQNAEESMKGQYVVDDPKKVPEFAAKMDELNQIECEVDIYQISEETFIDWGLSAEEMEPLVWMAGGE